MANPTIQLQNQDGTIVDFDVLGFIEYENNEYIILYPVKEDDGEVLILLVDENESYLSVDDDDLIETIFTLFKEKYQDEYIFDGEEEEIEDFEVEVEVDDDLLN